MIAMHFSRFKSQKFISHESSGEGPGKKNFGAPDNESDIISKGPISNHSNKFPTIYKKGDMTAGRNVKKFDGPGL